MKSKNNSKENSLFSNHQTVKIPSFDDARSDMIEVGQGAEWIMKELEKMNETVNRMNKELKEFKIESNILN